MPTKTETSDKLYIGYIAEDGKTNYVELSKLKSFDLSCAFDNIDSIYKNNKLYSNEQIEIEIKPRKMTRKRFKKLLMSRGVSRDIAEKVLSNVVNNRASYWTSWMMLNIGFGGSFGE